MCLYSVCHLETEFAAQRGQKPDDELWIGYAGTLGHSYNIEIVIDALNQIADKLTQKVVFKVLGDGPYLERFKEYAKDCKVQVDFLGRLEYSLMAAYLTHCDIEGQSLVCILYYSKVGGFNEGTVTHWMAVPEAPNVEGE